ncbi:DNA-3-methyladenine glycosylase [Legionella santicrucis]|uniref:DNA-3-methyladenine glycosylase II n=1 Tax=Legionella santicrucis TaxID=45074 RepID=A0A0W0YAU3_9GAMM|nr:DNA-3-methyladenine glycosylase [Legionella santicrucis]KTD53683.1 DNA-3-methyladenine glycosylase [Legionella santicrucis]
MNTSFSLSPVTPFRLDYTVWALRRRSKNIVEHWDGKHYSRLLFLDNKLFKIVIEQKNESQIYVSIDKNINPLTQDKVIAQLEILLGLQQDLQGFYQIAAQDLQLNQLVNQFKGLKPPRFPSLFEALVNAISCQQISLAAGLHIQNRLIETYGMKIQEKESVFYAFPRPCEIANSSVSALRKIGYSTHKCDTLIHLASVFNENESVFSQLETQNNEEIIHFLCSFKGIGRWTAEYVLLRGLGRLDVFPGDDIGAQNNLYRLLHLKSKPGYKEISEITAKWHPYAGLVYFHLLLQRLNEEQLI